MAFTNLFLNHHHGDPSKVCPGNRTATMVVSARITPGTTPLPWAHAMHPLPLHPWPPGGLGATAEYAWCAHVRHVHEAQLLGEATSGRRALQAHQRVLPDVAHCLQTPTLPTGDRNKQGEASAGGFAAHAPRQRSALLLQITVGWRAGHTGDHAPCQQVGDSWLPRPSLPWPAPIPV